MTKYIEPIFEPYTERLIRLYPEKFATTESILTLTFQVTEDCCMACSYCYQNHKTNNKMSYEIAQQIIYNLLTDDNIYNTNNVNGIILEFIGGEPFMEVELMDQIVDYFIKTAFKMHHRFLKYFAISISSNGLLYFNEQVQKFLKKYKNFLSIGISIDGNKELHDSCRLDLLGNGTYDRAIKAALDVKKYTNDLQTKMTLSPNNIHFLFDAVINLINLGYESISLNCVYEQGWEISHAKILYQELKKLSDWLFENDAFKKYRISLFNETLFQPLLKTNTNNWCGGICNGMLSFDYKGNAFPCIRYMNSSLNNKQIPYSIGNVNGLFIEQVHKDRKDLLMKITRQSQSTEECLNCPIASGCGWCSGYNYECFGTPDKRATFICIMHKSRSLANAYYYNKGYKLLGESTRLKINLPKEEAIKIISEEEWQLLKQYEE